ncbi:MAG TPA: radical SAM protein [Negativicutes bacterium]|jgi:MiaB/RimO family radical SAM methylthiotransferase
MKIYIDGNGCARRKLDLAKFNQYFLLNGHDVIDKPNDADFILVTTCAFKKEEEDNSINTINRLEKYNAKILVYGCLPEISPSRYNDSVKLEYLSPKKIDDIDKYFTNVKYKFSDVKDVNVIPEEVKTTSWTKAANKFINEFELTPKFISRTLKFTTKKLNSSTKDYYLFTSRGCMGNCSYCAVRFAVGTIQSKPIENVVNEFKEGVEKGYTDFMIIGDDVGAYGQDKGVKVTDLLRALLQVIDEGKKTDEYKKFKLNIDEFNPRWIIKYKDALNEILKSDHMNSILCPLQSGSDRVLKLMKRGHDAKSFVDCISNIRQLNAKIYLNTQLIIGFPTETEDDFKKSLELVKQAGFNSVILFPYDDKENTDASKIFPKIPEDLIQDRVKYAQKFFKKNKIKSFLSCE